METYRGATATTRVAGTTATPAATSTGGLTGLADKRVGIIGTGATAVQCIPHLAEGAKHLTVFQRTPSSIDVRNDRPTDPEWVRTLAPGWQRERMENFSTLVSGGVAEVDLVNDGWTEIIRNLLVLSKTDRDALGTPEKIAAYTELADFQKMNAIRARVDAVVKDPTTAEALKPWYRQFCKRPCFHDDYLPTFNRPNVTLVDTRGRGVDRVTPRGLVFDGVEHPLDCLIFATGFEVGTGYTRRSGYDPIGRDGVALSVKWREGARTLHGMTTHGFPNLFIMGTLQAGMTANFSHSLGEQAHHVAYVIGQARARGASALEPTREAEDEWVGTITKLAWMNEAYLEACTPGYYNNEGRPAARNRQNVPYGRGPGSYFRVLARWREDGSLPGLQLRGAGSS